MSDILLANEPLIRLSVFAGILAAMAAWEVVAPRREQKLARGTRWPGNLGIVVLDTVVVRLLVPTTAVGLALVAEARGWGLVHAFGLPIWASVLLAVVALDLAIYLQHVLFHAVPALWRLHRVRAFKQFRDPAEQRLDHMLTQPFRDDDTSYTLGRRGDRSMTFTSGGSEANNLAPEGVAWALRAKGDHSVTSAVEHRAVAGKKPA
jgi:hypothetical protein